MSFPYRFEHDTAILINMHAGTESLTAHQQRLEALAAKLARDIDVIAEELVRRGLESAEPVV